MQQSKSEIKRMIERARVGGYLSTLAYYVYMDVSPSLRINGVKGGPYCKPKDLVPVVPLLGSFEPAQKYDPCVLEEMELWSDVLVLLASWRWQGEGIIFSKSLTSLVILEELGTKYYNVLTDTCDHVCPGCGSVSQVFIFNFYENWGFPCPNCPPSVYAKSYVTNPEHYIFHSDRSLDSYGLTNFLFSS